MSAELTLPASELAKFNHSIRSIAAASGMAAKDVLRAEAGVILKTWAGRTKVSTKENAIKRGRKRLLRSLGLTNNDLGEGVTINAGIKKSKIPGLLWIKPLRVGKGSTWRVGGTVSDTGEFKVGYGRRNHFSDMQWSSARNAAAKFGQRVAKALAMAENTVGLGRQSVIQIADALGIKLELVRGGGTLSAEGIAKARFALAANGHRYVNGTGGQFERVNRFFIELVNRYPKNEKIKMDRTLAGVIAGRIQYFDKNMEQGVFLAQRRVAQKYPWLNVAA